MRFGATIVWVGVIMVMSGVAFGQATEDQIVDLSHVPQLNESDEQRDARMEWFRDAKFGMLICWGPCAIGKREIGWGRNASKPWDIRHHGPRTSDPVYDNYYKQFNPTNYNPEAWVTLAKAAGFKYIVMLTKHHDGFSMYDSALTEYDVMSTPYGRDVTKALAEACRKHDMPLGFYYSTRDWYHPDYLVGDNQAYDKWYRGQVEELLTHYGDIDIMWFDHVGGRDWSKWRFDKLFAMMYEKQPDLIVNDRAAKFCGHGAASKPKVPPVNADIRKMGKGDFITPEGKIGKMNLDHYWETCAKASNGWSYRGEEGTKDYQECVRWLVSCVTGGGNYLLSFGPRPDGTIMESERELARDMGDWVESYGDAIYGTRGGPYRNGTWGGSCHKNKTLYLHVYQFPANGLVLDPLPQTILSAENLSGETVQFEQTDEQLTIRVPEKHRAKPVTVIALKLEETIPPATLIGGIQ